MATPPKPPATKVPEEVKETLLSISQAKNIPMEQIKAEFQEIYDHDEVVSVITDISSRMHAASGVLANKYFRKGGGAGQTIFVRVISKSRKIKTPKSYVCDIVGIVMEADDEGKAIEGADYSCIALWGDAIDTASGVVIGKVYQTTAGKDSKQPEWGKTFSQFDKGVTWEEIELETMPDIEKFYNENIKPLEINVNLNQLDLNISKSNCDLRRLTVMVADARKNNDKTTGEEYYVYDVWDRRAASAGNVGIFVTKEQFFAGVGSILNIDVIIAKTKKGDVIMNAHFVHAVSLVPLVIRPKPVKPDSAEQETAREEPTGDPASEEHAEEEPTSKDF